MVGRHCPATGRERPGRAPVVDLTGPPPIGRSSTGTRTFVLATAFVISVLVGAAIVVFVPDRSDRSTVVLEGREDPGSDPFTESVATAAPDQVEVFLVGYEPPPVTTVTLPRTPSTQGSPTATVAVDGSTPGLYGGSGESAVCDPGALVDYLADHADKATAWAEVVGVDVGGIPTYIAGLTPVVLTIDTVVTNHGFADGRATPRATVLEAGTAVLVDGRGVPRVRCACGNPLTEPAPLAGPPEFTGEGWDGFQADGIVQIVASAADLTALEVASLDGSGPISVGIGELDEAIRAVDFENFTFTSSHPGMFEPCWSGTFEVVDGVGDYTPGLTPDLRRPVEEVFYGDLDGDRSEDAIVHLSCYSVADYVLHEFQLFSWDGTTAVFRDEVVYLGGTSLAFESAAMGAGAFTVDARRDPSSDPFYQVLRPVRFEVTWDGSAFVTEERDRTALAAERIVFGPDGFSEPASSDQGIAAVIAALSAKLGPPTTTGPGCEGQFASWETPDGGDGLSVEGSDRELLWIRVDSAMIGEVALVTEAGIAVGSTAEELEAAYPGQVSGPIQGINDAFEYEIGGRTFTAGTYDAADQNPVLHELHVRSPASTCD